MPKSIAFSVLFCLALPVLRIFAAEPAAPIPIDQRYREPILAPQVFNFEELGMIEAERREYAGNLAALALQRMAGFTDATGKIGAVPAADLETARKLVGLALHLDPRSRPGIIANGRLKSGVLPKREDSPGISAQTFASLLVGRAEELRKAGGPDNIRLAGCFLDIATLLDPANDDAIYAYETFKMDGMKADWRGILGSE